MVFHMTVVLDFPDEILMIGRPILGLSGSGAPGNASKDSAANAALSERLQVDIGVSEDEESGEEEEEKPEDQITSTKQGLMSQDDGLKSKSD